MKKKHFLLTAFLLSVTGLFAFETVSTEDLLLSYLQNDLDLQKLTLAAEKAVLSYDSSKIDTGVDVNLSSGIVTFKTTKNGLQCTTSPTLKVTIPQASNLSISTGIKVDSKSENVISDSTVSLGIDIISPTSKTNEITRLNAERTKDIAIRNLQQKAIDKEKEFYSGMKSLLNSMNTIIQSEKRLYTDMKDFETVKARGFSKSSSTYRLAEIQVFSDKTTIETQQKAFINDFILFYKKCGYTIDPSNHAGLDEIDIMTLIPKDIIYVNPVDVESYDKENFIEIENAKWTNKINSIKRNTNDNFSLSASVGYTFGNSITNSDTVNAGINSAIGGVNLQAGVNIPVKENPNPSFTLSASVSPNKFRKNNIKNKQNDLTEEQELLDIKIAENNYDNFVTGAKQDLEDLMLKKETTEQNLDMYESLEKDMAAWYKQGLVSESDYLSAKTNADSYKIKSVINNIDFIIYNNDISRKFIQEETENQTSGTTGQSSEQKEPNQTNKIKE